MEAVHGTQARHSCLASAEGEGNGPQMKFESISTSTQVAPVTPRIYLRSVALLANTATQRIFERQILPKKTGITGRQAQGVVSMRVRSAVKVMIVRCE